MEGAALTRPRYDGPGDPWDGTTLADLPPAAAVEGDRRLTSGQMGDRALRAAGGLVQRGVRPGDVVTFQLPPGVDAATMYHACWTAGAVAAPLHHRAGATEVAELVDRLQPRLSLTPDDLPDLLAATPATPARPDPAATAVLLATSGSGGRPKVVVHTHRALAYKARAMVAVHGLHDGDVVLMPAPMAHISGLLNGVLLPGRAGMTVVFLPRWSAATALELIAAERVSFMIGPPTYFVQLMAEPAFSADAVDSLRLISCGGAGVTEDFARTAAKTFDAVVKRTYGSTEAPTVTTSAADDPPERGWSTDGRPVGQVELRVDPGTEELWVRGPELFERYLDTDGGPDADGWFATGDRARLEDGWLVVRGRLGDMIIRGGENVDPRQVEEVCAGLPGVRQAVVVGYPDAEMGERVGLVVVAAAPLALDTVRQHCADAGLARFKHPERVLRLDELPVLTVGKPDRAALRRLLSD